MNKFRTRLRVQALEARDCPAADLVAKVLRVTLPDVVVPGDVGHVSFKITNMGDLNAAGTTGFHLYLSADATYGPGDVVIGKVQSKTLNLAPPKPGATVGGSVVFTGTVEMPVLSLPFPAVPEGKYFVLAEADSGGRIFEGNENNNVAASAEQYDYKFQFGDVGKRKGVPLTAASGGPIKFDLNGGGVGKIAPSGGVVDLTFEGTTNASSASATGTGFAQLRNITAGASMRVASLRAVRANGVLNFNGLGGLALSDLGGQATSALTVGTGWGRPVALLFGRVSEVDIQADSGVNVLTVGEWKNTNGEPDELNTPFIRALNAGPIGPGASGDFEATVATTGADATGFAIGKVLVAGTLGKSHWTLGGGAKGKARDIFAIAATDWRLTAQGDVDKLVIGTNYRNADTSAAALSANTFGTIKVTGDLSVGPIVASGPATNVRDNLAITELSFRTATTLPRVTALAGGIQRIKFGTWVAPTTVEAKWLGFLESNPQHKDLPAFGSLRPNLKLTGRKPGTNFSLTEVDVAGLILNCTWDVVADVKSIVAGGGASGWTFRGDQGTDNPGTRLGKLDLALGMEGSHLTFSGGAGTIQLGDMSKSSLKTAGDITTFNMDDKGTTSNGFKESTLDLGKVHRLTIRNAPAEFASASRIKARGIAIYTRFDGPIEAFGPMALTTPGTYDVVGVPPIYSVEIVA